MKYSRVKTNRKVYRNLEINSMIAFSVSVSIFGLIVMLVLGLYPPSVQDNLSFRKPILGVIYGLSCTLGVFAASYPKKCSGTLHFNKKKKKKASIAVSAALVGHHPNCEEFSRHVVQIGHRIFCAACTGLSIGAVIATFGIFFYIISGLSVKDLSLPLIAVGINCVILGLLQLRFGGFVRLFFNTLFVLGTLLVLIGIEEIIQSLYIGFFLILTTVFWLYTRITLSKWDHLRTCRNCSSKCSYAN